jgi:hypothetical protein
MQPQYGFQTQRRRIPKRVVWIGAVLILVGLGALIYHIQSFHVIKTDPKTSGVSDNSPFFKIYFSREIQGSGFTVTSTDNLVKSNGVSGKVLGLDFQSSPSLGKTYTIRVKNITSKDGAVIKDKSFTFTVEHIPYNKLSKDQQADILRNQDKFEYGVAAINYQGFDELLGNGLPSSQLAAIKQSLFDYSQVAQKEFWTMTVVSGSVSTAPYNPNSADTNSTIYFSVVLGKNTYKVTAKYDNLREDLRQLVIKDAAGSVIYDTLAGSD